MSATLKSLEAVKSKMNDQKQEFQQILKEFELQKQKFEEQKQQVEQYLAQNDVLHLNVGGEHFCTLRSTLTLIKGTILSIIYPPSMKNYC
jgi:ABC-type transporter Mla subunit MlaD